MRERSNNEKIIEILKQHPEGGEKFFDALDLMIRSDRNILTSFCLLIKDFTPNNGCAVLSGHFGRYMINTCPVFLRNQFSELLLVNGGIRTGAKVELDFLPHNKVLTFIDDSIYSGNTRLQILSELNRQQAVNNKKEEYTFNKTFVVYDGMKIRDTTTYSMFRYYDQQQSINIY